MQQDVLKKHVGAIQISGRLTLLQRKVFNVLLLNAYPQLPESEEFSISTTVLANMAGFDSHNTTKLKSSFKALARTTVEWNILEGEQEEQWTTSALLADATVMKNIGLCTYSYSNRLKQKLYHPDIYARINLAIQRRFSSAHGLVLYENCARFRNVQTTGWLSLDRWRQLFGIQDHQYSEFKALSRRVIKTAVDEVNAFSDLHVTPEYQKAQGRVVAIKFLIKSQTQPAMTREPAAKASKASLIDQLIALNLTYDDAAQLIGAHATAQIQANIDYVKVLIENGTAIRSTAGYVKKAIANNYSATQPAAKPPVKLADHHDDPQLIKNQQLAVIESLHKEQCYACITAQLNGMDTEAVQQAEQAFNALLTTSSERTLFKKRGWLSSLLYSHVLTFWKDHYNVTFPSLKSIDIEDRAHAIV